MVEVFTGSSGVVYALSFANADGLLYDFSDASFKASPSQQYRLATLFATGISNTYVIDAESVVFGTTKDVYGFIHTSGATFSDPIAAYAYYNIGAYLDDAYFEPTIRTQDAENETPNRVARVQYGGPGGIIYK